MTALIAALAAACVLGGLILLIAGLRKVPPAAPRPTKRRSDAGALSRAELF